MGPDFDIAIGHSTTKEATIMQTQPCRHHQQHDHCHSDNGAPSDDALTNNRSMSEEIVAI